jgi:hypothetical protein
MSSFVLRASCVGKNHHHCAVPKWWRNIPFEQHKKKTWRTLKKRLTRN